LIVIEKNKYSPSGTVSNTDITINLGFNYGTEYSYSESISWSYSIPDIAVSNHTDRNQQLFKLRYTYSNSSSDETRLVEPGMTSVVDCDNGYFKNGNLLTNETFTVEFKKRVTDYWLWIAVGSHWEYSDYTINSGSNVKANPCILTINGNGDNGNYIMEGDGTEYEPSVQDIYAQVAHTSLRDQGYYKNGCHLAGFSLNPNSTTPEFSIGQDYKINQDTTLFCIWQED